MRRTANPAPAGPAREAGGTTGAGNLSPGGGATTGVTGEQGSPALARNTPRHLAPRGFPWPVTRGDAMAVSLKPLNQVGAAVATTIGAALIRRERDWTA